MRAYVVKEIDGWGLFLASVQGLIRAGQADALYMRDTKVTSLGEFAGDIFASWGLSLAQSLPPTEDVLRSLGVWRQSGVWHQLQEARELVADGGRYFDAETGARVTRASRLQLMPDRLIYLP